MSVIPIIPVPIRMNGLPITIPIPTKQIETGNIKSNSDLERRILEHIETKFADVARRLGEIKSAEPSTPIDYKQINAEIKRIITLEIRTFLKSKDNNFVTLAIHKADIQRLEALIVENFKALSGRLNAISDAGARLQGEHNTLKRDHTALHGAHTALDASHKELDKLHGTLDTSHKALEAKVNAMAGQIASLESSSLTQADLEAIRVINQSLGKGSIRQLTDTLEAIGTMNGRMDLIETQFKQIIQQKEEKTHGTYVIPGESGSQYMEVGKGAGEGSIYATVLPPGKRQAAPALPPKSSETPAAPAAQATPASRKSSFPFGFWGSNKA